MRRRLHQSRGAFHSHRGAVRVEQGMLSKASLDNSGLGPRSASGLGLLDSKKPGSRASQFDRFSSSTTLLRPRFLVTLHFVILIIEIYALGKDTHSQKIAAAPGISSSPNNSKHQEGERRTIPS